MSALDEEYCKLWGEAREREMIRVRVLFLTKGQIAQKTDFDDCLTPDIEETCWADNLEDEYWKLSPHDLADGLSHATLSTVDPGVVILRDCILVYFDLLHLNSDWLGHGGIGHEVENSGLWHTFGTWLPAVLAHAEALQLKAKPAGWIFTGGEKKPWGPDGVRVQFLTVWNYRTTRHSSPNYGEDWDCSYELVGTLVPGEEIEPLINQPTETHERR